MVLQKVRRFTTDVQGSVCVSLGNAKDNMAEILGKMTDGEKIPRGVMWEC